MPELMTRQHRMIGRHSATGLLPTLITLLLLMLFALTAPSAVGETLPTHTLGIGDQAVEVELALTNAQRSRGLMEREEMAENAGMLFLYNTHSQRCFWMQNTLLPLTLAFLADDGTITQLVDMEPLSTETHCSTEEVRYALELNQGWFDRNDVSVGDRVKHLPRILTEN